MMLKAEIVQVHLGSAQRCDHREKAVREERGKDL